MKSIVFSILAGAILLSMLVLPAISNTFDDLMNDNTNTDAELVLAVDASGSIEANELTLQRVAYAKALRSDEFIRQATKGRHKSIAVYYFEFSEEPVRFVNWHVISDYESAREFANKIAALPHSEGSSTSISGALLHARDQLDSNEFHSHKRIIDLSADGKHNFGTSLKDAKEYALSGGRTTINGLAVIISVNEAVRGVFEHLEKEVIGGPGHFLYAIKSIEEMSEKILLKLLEEIA